MFQMTSLTTTIPPLTSIHTTVTIPNSTAVQPLDSALSLLSLWPIRRITRTNTPPITTTTLLRDQTTRILNRTTNTIPILARERSRVRHPFLIRRAINIASLRTHQFAFRVVEIRV